MKHGITRVKKRYHNSVPGYFDVTFETRKGEQLHDLDVGILQCLAMSESKYQDEIQFLESLGYEIKHH